MEKNIKTEKTDLKNVYVARLEEIETQLSIIYDNCKEKETYQLILGVKTRINLLKEDIKYLRP